MSRHKWGGALEDQLPYREWLRHDWPDGRDGCVVEDVDVLFRLFGPRYGLDAHGRFALLEYKYGRLELDHSQHRAFGLIDYLLRKADRDRRWYRGWHVVDWSRGPDDLLVADPWRLSPVREFHRREEFNRYLGSLFI